MNIHPTFAPFLRGVAPPPRFLVTYCSSCGEAFGPGDHGYSHCADHGESIAELKAAIRKPGNDAARDLILRTLKAHRFEGKDIAAMLYEAHEAMIGSQYMLHGSVDLEVVADTMSEEITTTALENEAEDYFERTSRAFS